MITLYYFIDDNSTNRVQAGLRECIVATTDKTEGTLLLLKIYLLSVGLKFVKWKRTASSDAHGDHSNPQGKEIQRLLSFSSNKWISQIIDGKITQAPW